MKEIIEDTTNKWNAKHDAFRQTTDFTDLMRVVSAYYEQYGKAVSYIGPYIARQHGSTVFFPPDKENLKSALGKERAIISFKARNALIDNIITFLQKNKCTKTLITPNPSSHHSAQFSVGTFTIKIASKLVLRDDKVVRKESKILHQIDFFGVEDPIYIENLQIPPEQIQFIIVRPKIGKLGTPCTSRWEVLLYKKAHGYLVEHVDSTLNPRWSGII